MRVMKTAIPRDDGSQLVCDTIQHDGKLWLVPAWLEEEATKPYNRPARLIGMSGLKYRSMPMRSEVDFVMEHPVPEAILEGRVQGAQSAPFLILERPDVRILKSVLNAPVDRTVIDQA
jgi:hypothetical protein